MKKNFLTIQGTPSPGVDSVKKFLCFKKIRGGARRKVVSALDFAAESSQQSSYGR
jgi:hypothetical protein